MTDLAELFLEDAEKHLENTKKLMKEVDKDGDIHSKRIS